MQAAEQYLYPSSRSFRKEKCPSAMLATSTDCVVNWHNRLGHHHFGAVVRLEKLVGLDKDWESKCNLANDNSDEHLCETCIFGERIPTALSS
jgi:hypothetical protein